MSMLKFTLKLICIFSYKHSRKACENGLLNSLSRKSHKVMQIKGSNLHISFKNICGARLYISEQSQVACNVTIRNSLKMLTTCRGLSQIHSSKVPAHVLTERLQLLSQKRGYTKKKGIPEETDETKPCGMEEIQTQRNVNESKS